MQRSNLIIETNHQKSPTIKNFINALSPGKDANEKPILMTRRELTDPFGSDDEDDKTDAIKKSPPKELMSPPPAIDNVTLKLVSLVLNYRL